MKKNPYDIRALNVNHLHILLERDATKLWRGVRAMMLPPNLQRGVLGSINGDVVKIIEDLILL